MDFIFTVRQRYINMWRNKLTCKWCTFLRSKHVHVENASEDSQSEALRWLLFRDVRIPGKPCVAYEELRQEDTPPHEVGFSSSPVWHNDVFETRLDRQMGPRNRT